MKKTSKIKMTALVLAAMFTTMQFVSAETISTGIGDISGYSGGFKGADTLGNTTTVTVDGNTAINWDTLNVSKNQTWNINGNGSEIVLNTVSQGMSTFAGSVNSNVGKLIIANPNGMFFDGAKFTATGDLLLTTKDCSMYNADDLQNLNLSDVAYSKIYENGKYIKIKIDASDIEVNGDYTIFSPYVNIRNTHIGAGNFKIVTANGADYTLLGNNVPSGKTAVTYLTAVSIDGDVQIINPEGSLSIQSLEGKGSEINGNLKVDTKGDTYLNYYNSGNRLVVNGDVDVTSHGELAKARNIDVKGNVKIDNDGGCVELRNANIDGDVYLHTTGEGKNSGKVELNHFVHVSGETNIKGNLTIESSENIHIGGYDFDSKVFYDGKLTVGGNLYAHATEGHITTTIDTFAKSITYVSDNYNILTDGNAVLTAELYDFTANGYIGGIQDYQNAQGQEMSRFSQIVDIMENYKKIPADINSHDYLNIAGGEISNITVKNKTGAVYISSNEDLLLTGANANDINLVAPDKYIHITGDNVHADNINIGGRTDIVEVDFPSRDFTLNYTNIRDGVVTTVKPDEVITYELTNEPENGYNSGVQTAYTTFLVGPGIEPTPVEPVLPPDEPERHLNYVPEDVTEDPVETPTSYAADLDDDQEGLPIRKNVDGSVTVVKKIAVY